MRKPDVIHSTTTDGILALHIDSGACFAFGGPSARIWELLEQPITAEQAAGRLVREYVVDEDECRDQVRAYLDRLRAEGLVAIVDTAA